MKLRRRRISNKNVGCGAKKRVARTNRHIFTSKNGLDAHLLVLPANNNYKRRQTDAWWFPRTTRAARACCARKQAIRRKYGQKGMGGERTITRALKRRASATSWWRFRAKRRRYRQRVSKMESVSSRRCYLLNVVWNFKTSKNSAGQHQQTGTAAKRGRSRLAWQHQ